MGEVMVTNESGTFAWLGTAEMCVCVCVCVCVEGILCVGVGIWMICAFLGMMCV